MDRMRSISDDRDEQMGDESVDAAPPPVIGQDERRMHVRAYNFWAKLLGSRSFPAIDDLDLDDLGDFGEHAVLLDFTSGIDNPAIAYVGDAVRAECNMADDVAYIDDVPRRSLLSRLTDHYLQIIANRAPIGFEAEFVNERGYTILYRGVLLPFSSDDDTIDFILGVINWKQAAEPELVDAITREVAAAASLTPSPRPSVPYWADGPDSAHATGATPLSAPAHDSIESPTLADDGFAADDGDDDELLLSIDAMATDTLADRLAAARECAAQAQQANMRGHRALYDAIGRAWDFARASRDDAETYSELLDEAGIKPSPRAPMTPVAKLVFGVDYDKTRLAEIATVLRYAEREDVAPTDLPRQLASHAGGLKGLIKAERALQRAEQPASAADRDAAARDALRHAPVRALIDWDAGEDEFVVLVARRTADGQLAIVAEAVSAQAARLVTQAGHQLQ